MKDAAIDIAESSWGVVGAENWSWPKSHGKLMIPQLKARVNPPWIKWDKQSHHVFMWIITFCIHIFEYKSWLLHNSVYQKPGLLSPIYPLAQVRLGNALGTPHSLTTRVSLFALLPLVLIDGTCIRFTGCMIGTGWRCFFPSFSLRWEGGRGRVIMLSCLSKVSSYAVRFHNERP